MSTSGEPIITGISVIIGKPLFCCFAGFFVLKRKETFNMSRAVKDFEGREFRSVAEMCEFHNMGYRTYLRRIERGWSEVDALTKPVEKHPKWAKLSEKEQGKLYRENHKAESKAYREKPENKAKAKAYQVKYREQKRKEKAESRKKKCQNETQEETMNPLSAWYEIMSAINTKFQTLNVQEFERLSFEDLLISIGDIKLEYAVAKSPFLWQRANEYFKQKKRESVLETFFENEIDEKKGEA